MTSQLTIPGPLHPDFFDGESPVRIPLHQPLRMYQVRVTYRVIEHHSSMVRVAGTSEQEAARLAVHRVESNSCEDDDDFDAEYCEELEGVKPTQEDVDAWDLARGEC